jgi:metal-dependent amidase/aminoacylase/carboxypeptidase family protein
MSKPSPSPVNTVLKDLPSLLPDLETLYKDVHAHPELSMQETRTADLAAAHLRDNGYDPTLETGVEAMVSAAMAWLAR